LEGKQEGSLYLRISIAVADERWLGYNNFKLHTSFTAGIFTGSSEDFIPAFSLFEVELYDINKVFQGKKQHWNVNYKAAQMIFGPGTAGEIVRTAVRAQHSSLYREGTLRTYSNKFAFGQELLQLLRYGVRSKRRYFYTYAITDKWRFSETGADFFKDFMSKHAMHSNCGEEVYYAGEFHIQKPPTGPARLVLDNNSGTYGPDKNDLQKLKALFQLNFPDLEVEALDFNDPKLAQYKKEMEEQNRKISFF